MAPQRILAINPGAELYGSDRVFLAAVTALCAGGDRVTVVTPEHGPLDAELRKLGVAQTVTAFPVLRKKYSSPKGLLALAGEVLRAILPIRRLWLRDRPDVVLVNTSTVPFWSLVGRLGRVPVVVYVHEAEANHPRAVRRMLALALRVANAVIFNSETSARVSARELGRLMPDLKVVPNTVRFGPPLPPVPADRPGHVAIALVGRLSPRKGTDVAVAALAGLRAAGIDAELSIVGDVFPGYEGFRAELDRMVREHDLGAYVRFHGFLEDPTSILADSHVVWVPSVLGESFGNVLVEALAAGRPVVASTQDGLVEAAAGSPVVAFVAPGDAKALASATNVLLRQWPEVTRQLPAAATSVREYYSQTAYATRFRAAFRELS